MRKLLFFLGLLLCGSAFAQVIPSERRVDWSLAGYHGTTPSYVLTADITEFGGVGDGVTVNDEAFVSALQSLNGMPGVIYFPSGTYLFHKKWNLHGNLIIRGESPATTVFKFDLSGAAEDLITLQGETGEEQAVLIEDASAGTSSITVNHAEAFHHGDYIKIFQNDSTLVASDWALHTVGQVMLVSDVKGNKIFLSSPLRKNYLTADYIRIVKLKPVMNTGFECFTIQRLDATTAQTSNIMMNIVAKCWVKGIISYMSNFAHVAVSASTNVEIRDSYFHHAFGYGGGGQGYGVALQLTAGECKVENNIFSNLRHAMLLQAGANGNVFGYNYSFDPIRTEIPSNASGDIVLHGNYVYANLFEGNICQTIMIDNSHGINGPYNTFFRNSIRLYGIIMNSTSPSNYQNFVGNEICNTQFLMGNYLLYGKGHFEYGNNLRGTIAPAGTELLADASYYQKQKQSFLSSLTIWPSIGTPNALATGNIPALANYQAGNFALCGPDKALGNYKAVSGMKLNCYPNPVQDKLFVEFGSPKQLMRVELYNHLGINCLSVDAISGEAVDVSGLAEGVYILKAGGKTFRLVKSGK